MNKVFTWSFLFLFLSLGLIKAQNNFEVITPDADYNSKYKNKSIEEVDLIRYETSEEGFTLDPNLPSDWTWIAGRNLQTDKGRIDFFLWSGYFFTNSSDVKYVSFRSRTFPDLFTDKIEANTFVIGFQKEDQGILFAATDEAKEVFIKLDKSIMGRELTYNFWLNKNEAKLIRITRKNPPYLP